MAVNRYTNTNIVKDGITGKRYYSTMLFPSPPQLDSDIFIISRDGDRLDSMANRVYGDSTLWWVIAAANGLHDSFYIPPGTKLRIPTDLQLALSYINEINESR